MENVSIIFGLGIVKSDVASVQMGHPIQCTYQYFICLSLCWITVVLISNFFNLVIVSSDGYAPFLSMTARETFLDVGDSIVAAPGPGQYDPGVVSERVKGGHTLANRVCAESSQIEIGTP